MPLTRIVAARRRLQIGDRAQQRRLAAARGADEGDELAARDLQIDAAQRLHRPVAGLKAQRQRRRCRSTHRALVGPAVMSARDGLGRGVRLVFRERRALRRERLALDELAAAVVGEHLAVLEHHRAARQREARQARTLTPSNTL